MKTLLKQEMETITEATLIRVIEKNDSLPETVQNYIAKMNALTRERKASLKIISIGQNLYYVIFDPQPSINGSYALDEALEELNNVGMYDSLFIE
jgi:hypothetical protein